MKGYEGLYAAEEDGKIWSYPKPCSSKYGKWLKPIPSFKQRNKGTVYTLLFVHLFKDHKSKSFLIHRLVAETFIPNPDNKPQINHKDGNPMNNNINNLEWVNAFENMRHAQANGLLNQFTDKQIEARSKYGKLNWAVGAKAHCKFTIDEAKQIKETWTETKKSFASIGMEFGVSPKTIANICYNKTYQFEIVPIKNMTIETQTAEKQAFCEKA